MVVFSLNKRYTKTLNVDSRRCRKINQKMPLGTEHFIPDTHNVLDRIFGLLELIELLKRKVCSERFVGIFLILWLLVEANL